MAKDSEDYKNRQERSLIKLSGWGKLSQFFRGVLLMTITLIVFLLLFRQINIREVIELLKNIQLKIWIIATLLTLSFPVMTAIRWHLILKTMGYQISILNCLMIIIGIWPISSVSPTKSGDFLKAFSLRKEIKPIIIAGSVLTERVLDLLFLALFALLGGLFFGEIWIVIIASFVVSAVVLAMILAQISDNWSFGRKYLDKLDELLQSMRVLRSTPQIFGLIIILTAANWFASIVQTKFLFDGVGANVSLGFTAAALPIAIFAGLLPITFGGMGTRDSAMVILFASLSSSSQSLTVALLYSFFGYWLLALIGIPFIKRGLKL